jgi:hypothetical protein
MNSSKNNLQGGREFQTFQLVLCLVVLTFFRELTWFLKYTFSFYKINTCLNSYITQRNKALWFEHVAWFLLVREQWSIKLVFNQG